MARQMTGEEKRQRTEARAVVRAVERTAKESARRGHSEAVRFAYGFLAEYYEQNPWALEVTE
jgi:hypothetical protein